MSKENKEISPEDKALEIQQQLFFVISRATGGKLQGSFTQGVEIRNWAATDCAEILCDQIIKEIEPDELYQVHNERVRYWQSVKSALLPTPNNTAK